MIIEIHTTQDLTKLEEAVAAHVGAQRLDVSILRSRPYITFRQNIVKSLECPDTPAPQGNVYFSGEQLLLRQLCSRPITVWCGVKDAEIFDEVPSI